MLSDLLRTHSELGPEVEQRRASPPKPRFLADASFPPCLPTPNTPLHLLELELGGAVTLATEVIYFLKRYWYLGVFISFSHLGPWLWVLSLGKTRKAWAYDKRAASSRPSSTHSAQTLCQPL